METEKFESWAIVEIFGHDKIAGMVTEATIGGCSFVRVDVPEHKGQKPFTKLYGNGAIYSMTPCSEEVARAALNHIMPEPVNVWMPELRKLPAPGDVCENCDGGGRPKCA